MLDYDFMVTAFLAAGIVGAIAGVVGFFLVLRGQTFAGHALSHVGFAGATGAVVFGLPPLAGLIGLTLIAGLGMGLLGERLTGRDVAIGVVLSLSLGLGLLFLHFYTSYATQVTALLFGNVLGVDRATLWTLLGIAVVGLGTLTFAARPLIFASLQPELAEAKGVSLPLVSLLFLAVTAITVAGCVKIVGVLLVFTLMVGPAAAAARMTSRLRTGVLLAPLLAVAEAWAGIALAYYTDWPVSVWIAALSGAVFLLTFVPLGRRPAPA